VAIVREQPASLPDARPLPAASRRLRVLAGNGALALGYWALVELALLPATGQGRVTPMWPAAGLAVAVVLLGGHRFLPGAAAGALLGMMLRVPLAAAMAVAAAIVVQAIIDVQLLRRLGFDPRLQRVRDPLLLCGAAMIGAIASASIGLLAMSSSGAMGTGDSVTWGWTLWWMRDWLGVQLVVSLVLSWTRTPKVVWTWRRVAEALALAAGMLLGSQLLFGLWALFPEQNVPLAFVLFPVVGYAGWRFGPAGVATIVMAVAMLALPVIAMGIGPFSTFPIAFTQSILHVFLLLASVSGHTLAAVMAEREEALQRRLALEEQLRHSQKMEAVGRLAGGIAHDFNNLLTAILGYAEIVMVSFDADDPRRADAEEIARAATRAADLTRQMLAFSRKQAPGAKVIDLNRTITRVEPMLRRILGADVVMTIAPRATHPHVRGDPGQIEQVIVNLAVNARDAMPKGGRLTVETADATLEASQLPPELRPGDYVMLAVSDTGVGMSADVRARIFEPYFTTKDLGKGTGLGLSIAYGIVRQHEGHIAVLSEAGQGTTFRIYLPPSAPEATAEAVVGADDLPSGNEHVLLIEDDPSVRRLSRDVLTRLGYSVTEAASGRAGLALGSDETRHFDMALCDVILGDMSGPAVYEALRALRPSVRVLYMSGYADAAIVRTGVLGEGHAFLQKPFTPRELALQVRGVLDAQEDV
jgi:signal transduction histidine kinase/CheY-like chemotaxis protein